MFSMCAIAVTLSYYTSLQKKNCWKVL